MQVKKEQLQDRGWCRFGPDVALLDWVRSALPVARQAISDPRNARHLLCDGTWFCGTNLLANDTQGAVIGGPNLAGAAIKFVHGELGFPRNAWDAAQISVCYPGYPQPMDGESEAAYRYRVHRDAAHVDGVLAEGPKRRRHVREHHAFLLGIPLVEVSPNASPIVVWEGSHAIIGETFRQQFDSLPPESWGKIDVTDAYWSARRQVFAACRRVEISARPGEAYVVHRFALHGITPWACDAPASAGGRIVVYFRPAAKDPAAWLHGR
jgi:hypothetical protein